MNRKPKLDYSIRSVTKALSLLEQFLDAKDELKLTEMSLTLDTNKNYILRLLATLESHGYVERNDRTRGYRLGRKILTLGRASIGSRHVATASHQALKHLAGITEETVFCAMLHGASLSCASMVESTLPVRVVSLPEEHIPLHCTAAGKLLLAFNPDRAAKYVEAGLKPYSDRTIVSAALLLGHLREIRDKGYAVEREEYQPGLCGVAAPVRDFSSRVIAAVSVAAPSCRFDADRVAGELAPLVVEAATTVSRQLGYKAPCGVRHGRGGFERIQPVLAL